VLQQLGLKTSSSHKPTPANWLARLKLVQLQTSFSQLWASSATTTPVSTVFNNKTSVFEGLPAKHRTEATHPWSLAWQASFHSTQFSQFPFFWCICNQCFFFSSSVSCCPAASHHHPISALLCECHSLNAIAMHQQQWLWVATFLFFSHFLMSAGHTSQCPPLYTTVTHQCYLPSMWMPIPLCNGTIPVPPLHAMEMHWCYCMPVGSTSQCHYQQWWYSVPTNCSNVL